MDQSHTPSVPSIPSPDEPKPEDATDAMKKNTLQISPEEWERRKKWAKEQLAKWADKRNETQINR